jgi:hypothetical protein
MRVIAGVMIVLLLFLAGVCWLIGRCVRWMRLGYWRHE